MGLFHGHKTGLDGMEADPRFGGCGQRRHLYARRQGRQRGCRLCGVGRAGQPATGDRATQKYACRLQEATPCDASALLLCAHSHLSLFPILIMNDDLHFSQET